MEGWIKIHRQIKDWEWYNDSIVKDVFIELLLRTNFKASKYHGIDVPTGSCIAGRKELATTLGFTEMQIRRALNALEKSQEITIKTTNKYSMITICNWATYQDINELNNQQNNQQTTNKQPTNNQQTTTSKELKNSIIQEGKNNTCSAYAQPYDERCKAFYDELTNYIGKYPNEMLREFYDYWSEETQNTKVKKMRKETQKTWNTNLRLRKWAKNNINQYNHETNFQSNQTSQDRFKQPHSGTFTSEQFAAIVEVGNMLAEQDAVFKGGK